MPDEKEAHLEAMLVAVYKKLLEIESQVKSPSGGGGTHPAWSVIKELGRETEKVKAELNKSGG